VVDLSIRFVTCLFLVQTDPQDGSLGQKEWGFMFRRIQRGWVALVGAAAVVALGPASGQLARAAIIPPGAHVRPSDDTAGELIPLPAPTRSAQAIAGDDEDAPPWVQAVLTGGSNISYQESAVHGIGLADPQEVSGPVDGAPLLITFDDSVLPRDASPAVTTAPADGAAARVSNAQPSQVAPGRPLAIPLPPAVALFPLGAAAALWARRRLSRRD
jgi:hypothetical protein